MWYRKYALNHSPLASLEVGIEKSQAGFWADLARSRGTDIIRQRFSERRSMPC